MNTFELKVWDDESRLCTFYTVHCEGSKLSETDMFFERYENDPLYEEAVQELLSFILYSIGDDHGALDALFNRFENEVIGLPSKGRIKMGSFTYHYPNFPLRIYALKITEQIVVLFGGGVKDGPTNQTSSLNIKWVEACQFSRKIIQSLDEGDILINNDEQRLTNYYGEDQIII